jgi:two-component system response regulator HydG
MRGVMESLKGRVLIVEDNDSLRAGIKLYLEDEGHEVVDCQSGEEAFQMLETDTFDLIITDIKMGDISGIEVMGRAKEINRDVEVIVITAFATPETAIKALRLGAFDYIQKPFEMYELWNRINNALSFKRYKDDMEYFRGILISDSETDYLIALSGKMKKIMRLSRKVAPTKATVLISGETGTGKERLATFIHMNSPRKDNRIVKVNCAALHENLLESELFGHEKGAFTSAEKTRIGKFEAANKGTIFLDEIGDMSQATQAKVLRVLQEQEFERLGSNTTIKVDVRVIAATNKNLAKEVEKGNFRKDLFYRLNIINIDIPPIRERREDIMALARHYVDFYALEFSKKVLGFTPGGVRKLENYSWPGNVRELHNVIERAVLLCEGDLLDESDLLTGNMDGNQALGRTESEYDLKEMEKQKIIDALKRSGFVQKNAALVLGVSPRVLNYKLKIHNIDWKSLRKEYQEQH